MVHMHTCRQNIHTHEIIFSIIKVILISKYTIKTCNDNNKTSVLGTLLVEQKGQPPYHYLMSVPKLLSIEDGHSPVPSRATVREWLYWVLSQVHPSQVLYEWVCWENSLMPAV